jgi:A/G-specific adenine glycosylase
VYDGPRRTPQRFAGTDRQVRGLLLSVLRDAPAAVPAAALDAVWSQAEQRRRALAGLISDGLVVCLDDGTFALPG